jgi:membrane protein YdbS with pleckstrin-like domain
MSKIKTVAIDFVSVFFFAVLSQAVVFGTGLFDVPWAEWKQVAASAVVAGLGVIIVALNPTVKKYGVGSE